uniref:Uncharacterized protein n=1 Tax=viral metagenome TaxID=1070528 RepID=A0A6C0F393_9ZZZZ
MPRLNTRKNKTILNKDSKKTDEISQLETMENSCSMAYYLDENSSFQEQEQEKQQQEKKGEEGNISYFFNDDSNFSGEANLLELMKEFEDMEIKQAIDETSAGNIEDDFLFAEIQNYTENYTVKQLMQICDYYGIAKDIKTFKCKKPELINYLLVFENDEINFELVMKRKQMWHCIEELKNDKYMKKFVIWD